MVDGARVGGDGGGERGMVWVVVSGGRGGVRGQAAAVEGGGGEEAREVCWAREALAVLGGGGVGG